MVKFKPQWSDVKTAFWVALVLGLLVGYVIGSVR
jgi:hypothetical protein